MAITLASAKTELTDALAALKAARRGGWSAGEFSSQPPTIEQAQRDVDYWQQRVNELSVTKAGSAWAAVGRWTG